MSNMNVDQTVFSTWVSSIDERKSARLLIDSIRSFGGALSGCPIWVFEADPQRAPCEPLEQLGAQVFRLTIPDSLRNTLFADKVCACAQAEALASPETRSLVWLSPECLIVKPPLLFDLGPSSDAAVRPVHIRNIGLAATEPLDDFWKTVFKTVGVPDIRTTVESFVDVQHIRAYFNSAALVVNPTQGLFQRWFECFEALANDQEFQLGACRDRLYQIFLHQAILSTLLVSKLDPERIRALPPDYGYPYNLHQSVPVDRKAVALNDLVCVIYEERSVDPGVVDDINIDEPLRSWLSSRFAHSQGDA